MEKLEEYQQREWNGTYGLFLWKVQESQAINNLVLLFNAKEYAADKWKLWHIKVSNCFSEFTVN